MRRTTQLSVIALALLLACGREQHNETATAPITETKENPAAEPPPPQMDRATPSSIAAEQIDGVWVFFWPDKLPKVPAGVMSGDNQALLQGQAKVSSGCLRVNETIAIWRTERRDEIRAAIRGAKAGKIIDLKDGGSTLWSDPSSGDPEAEAEAEAMAEADRTVITTRCATSEIFGTGRLAAP